MSPALGRYDALNGLVFKGNGKGNFKALTIQESGFYIPSNGKALSTIVINQQMGLIATQNRDYVKLFIQKQRSSKIIKWYPNDQYCLIHLKNGQIRKEEFALGTGFLSQLGNAILLNEHLSSVEIFNNKGGKRIVSL